MAQTNRVFRHMLFRSSELDPLLQQLHEQGGILTGPVQISTGRGMGRWMGRRLAKKLGIPLEAGQHTLTVQIAHSERGLHWDRHFDKNYTVPSLFEPVGSIQQGCWLESIGPFQLQLTVDIKNGGWYWRCLRIRFKGLSVPAFLFPKTNAYKCIEQGAYRFHVSIQFPLIGTVLRYEGLLHLRLD